MTKMMAVIVAVEGPTAAGKTTWCKKYLPEFVGEYKKTGSEPDDSDLQAQATYWASVNAQRWTDACALEQRIGTAVCDSDPLKLHYSWSLARIGAAPWRRFELELRAVREAFVAHSLGLADLVLISVPTAEVLRRQRDKDRSRFRRSFELHAQLAQPLQEWYSAVDLLDPGRVIWQFPPRGVPAPAVTPRDNRSAIDVLDQLVALLP